MPCTRLYLDPTTALVSQTMEKIPLIIINQQWENMRGHSSFFIITTSKDNTQSFKKAENKNSKRQETGYEGYFLALYVIIEVSPPPPWMCPLHSIPPDIKPLPPPSSVQFPFPHLLGLVPWWWRRRHPPPPPLLHIFIQGGKRCSECPIGGICIP